MIVMMMCGLDMPCLKLLPCPLKTMVWVSEAMEMREQDIEFRVGCGYYHHLGL